ncbi:MAG: hypothetical protein COB07_06945 [Sulfurovum sp.]|nr:MAG: hypothetical protein COB07_06945 [Sulfurovum sp.]
MNRTEKRNIHYSSFPEDEVKLVKTMMDKMGTTLEFFYYLMNNKRESATMMILLSADDVNLEHLLPKWKRNTDVLFELDKERNVYVIICQSTDSEGVKQFAEILIANIRLHSAHDIYCVVSESKTASSSAQEVIFKMVEKYIKIKDAGKANRVFFTDLKNAEEPDVIYNGSPRLYKTH